MDSAPGLRPRVPAPTPAAARATVLLYFVLATLALALAACGDDQDVRIVALTRTPAPEAPAPATGVADADADADAPTASAPVALPEVPENPLAGGLLVAAYLAGGQADLPGCLPELVAAWGLAPADGARCLLADLDGDGADEYVFVITLPSEAGDVWFFESAAEDFRLASSARVLANELLERVRLLATDDLTGDGAPDPVIAAERCGAAGCLTRFIIASTHLGTLADLAPRELLVANVEAAGTDDATDDGLPDLVLRGGAVTGVGAGPPRATARVISWGGVRFFDREQPDAPEFLFHAIVDADQHYARGDYTAARGAYLLAVAEASLRDWRAEAGQPAGRPELVSYAVFRAGLGALKDGDTAGGLALLRTAAADAERTLHGRAAAAYEAALGSGGTPTEACAAAEAVLDAARAEFARIWDYGFANPEHAIAGVCR